MRGGARALPLCRALLIGVTALALMGFFQLWSLPEHPASPAPVAHSVWLTPRAPPRLLPHDYWAHRRAHPENYEQLSCSKFPSPGDLERVTASWQRLAVKNGSVFAYSAHWDARGPKPLVRLLVYCDVTPLPNLTCLLW